ncbi:MAG: DUF2797 domain-containing protein [Cryomorphaceae bacterium]|nr:DUF2797 domain-containing protein [Cryomorphaceae bacterium]
MEYRGYLQKMAAQSGEKVHYYLNLGSELIFMNELIGREIALTFQHKITCFCGKELQKVFRQNYCYDCFMTKPEAGQPIFFPEKSQAHLGIEDRDLEFEKRYQLQPHVVYLANSGGLKVGVTRKNARFNRWIDQGAIAAVVLAETENRYQAGQLEVYLKEHLSDKTDWRNMLSQGDPEFDLIEEAKRVADLLSEEFKPFVVENFSPVEMTYPVEKYPEKVKSITFKKQDECKGVLQGIRGQYLLLEGGGVFNVRSHEGHHVTFAF